MFWFRWSMTSFAGSLAAVCRRAAPITRCNLLHWFHEAYLRLANRDSLTVRDRAHFYAMAAQMMRQILIDYARKQQAAKRGGLAITLSLDQALFGRAPAEETDLDLLALDDAMKQLALLDARQCQIVELRFFGGLSIEETAEVVDISQATTKREWATARVWLHRTLSKGAIVS